MRHSHCFPALLMVICSVLTDFANAGVIASFQQVDYRFADAAGFGPDTQTAIGVPPFGPPLGTPFEVIASNPLNTASVRGFSQWSATLDQLNIAGSIQVGPVSDVVGASLYSSVGFYVDAHTAMVINSLAASGTSPWIDNAFSGVSLTSTNFSSGFRNLSVGHKQVGDVVLLSPGFYNLSIFTQILPVDSPAKTDYQFNVSFSPSTVPEPSTFTIACSLVGAIGLVRRLRGRSSRN